MTLAEIASNLRSNGKWGKRASRQGWRWLASERRDLEAYLANLGVDVSGRLDCAAKQRVWIDMVNQVEWIAENGD